MQNKRMQIKPTLHVIKITLKHLMQMPANISKNKKSVNCPKLALVCLNKLNYTGR